MCTSAHESLSELNVVGLKAVIGFKVCSVASDQNGYPSEFSEVSFIPPAGLLRAIQEGKLLLALRTASLLC